MDQAAFERRLARALTKAGIVDPEVTVRHVSEIERHLDTGETLRFIPLPSHRSIRSSRGSRRMSVRTPYNLPRGPATG
jgi:hypothetical protein